MFTWTLLPCCIQVAASISHKNLFYFIYLFFATQRPKQKACFLVASLGLSDLLNVYVLQWESTDLPPHIDSKLHLLSKCRPENHQTQRPVINTPEDTTGSLSLNRTLISNTQVFLSFGIHVYILKYYYISPRFLCV